MIFVSRYGGHKVVLSADNVNTVQTPSGPIAVPYKGKRVQFQEMAQSLAQPMFMGGSSTRFAHGILDSESAARQIGVSEEEAIRRLAEFPWYGNDYVGLDDSGNPMTREQILASIEPDDGDEPEQTASGKRRRSAAN